MDVVLHASRSHGAWQSLWSPRSSLARNASTSFRTISRRSNSHSPRTSLGSWMRSALLPLSIQGGCCRSREPTVWSQLIAGSVSARRASRIDPANLLPTQRQFPSSRPIHDIAMESPHEGKGTEARFGLLWRRVARALYARRHQGNPEAFAGVKSISFDFEIRTSS